MKDADWKLLEADRPRTLPAWLDERYPWIPENFRELACHYDTITRRDDTLWIISAIEYCEESDIAFAWNAWELLLLESPWSSAECKKEISAFWDNHFPLSNFVESRYEYYAHTREGKIVHGHQLEFEETSPFAENIAEFIRKLAALKPIAGQFHP